MAESEISWAEDGESFDAEGVRHFRELVLARLAELESIDAGRDADPSKCGL